MKLNLNEAQSNTQFDPIPDGETVHVIMKLHAGDDGTIGGLMKSKNTAASYLKAEFTVTEGKYARRKFFQNFTLATTDEENEGHEKAISISRSTLRAICEAVKGVAATDETPEALKARDVDTAWFDGREFAVTVGISPARDGYQAQNQIKRVVNPVGAVKADAPVTRAAFSTAGQKASAGKWE